MLKVHAPETHWLSPKMPELAKLMNEPGIDEARIMISEAGAFEALSVQIDLRASSYDAGNTAIVRAFELLLGDRAAFIRRAPHVVSEKDFQRDAVVHEGSCRFVVLNKNGEREVAHRSHLIGFGNARDSNEDHLSTGEAIDGAEHAALSVASNRE